MIEKIFEKIKEDFSETRVYEKLDDEVLNWVVEDWKDDGFESEYDWYCDFRNGEAESVIIHELIVHYEESKKLNVDERIDLIDLIKNHYGFVCS